MSVSTTETARQSDLTYMEKARCHRKVLVSVSTTETTRESDLTYMEKAREGMRF